MINSSDAAILEIGDFIMRPIQFSDLDALATIWADPEVTRFLPSRGVPIKREGASNIKFHKAGFLSYEHRDKLADFVVIKNALHILPDFWKMIAFTRIAAMLKSKGVLYLRDAIFSFPPADYESSINEWIRQVAKPEGEGWTARDFEMHMREEHSTFAWIIEGMLTRAGFEIVEVNYNTATYAEYLCIKTAC